MKNIPRLYLDTPINPGDIIPLPADQVHYLTRVMRTDTCRVFHDGAEYNARLGDGNLLTISDSTGRPDPANNITLYFAPIKRVDDLLNMATQMGVRAFVPVITQRTVANHINWHRMRKIVIESAEQSGRNSVPTIGAPIKFSDLDLAGLAYGDERAADGMILAPAHQHPTRALIGPEGGFSPDEFDALGAGGAVPYALGKTILRAEVAAVVMVAKLLMGDA